MNVKTKDSESSSGTTVAGAPGQSPPTLHVLLVIYDFITFLFLTALAKQNHSSADWADWGGMKSNGKQDRFGAHTQFVKNIFFGEIMNGEEIKRECLR